jgi:hypothetical protein
MPATAVQLQITPDDRLALARAVDSFFSLIAYDHAWTGLLQDRQSDDADQRQLTLILSELLQDLATAGRGAAWLREFVNTNSPGRIVDAMAEVAASTSDDYLREEAGRLISHYGSQLGELAEAGYAGLTSNEVPQFAALLSEANAAIRSQHTDGDLLTNILCSAATLMVAGGMVSTAVPPFIHGPVIAGVGVGAFTAFKCKLKDLERKEGWQPGK